MKVAIIGTVGVPANYGGFETLAEQLVRNKRDENIQYTVFCSSRAYDEKIHKFHGADIRYVPLKANGIQSIPYDIISMIKAMRKCDVLLVLGVSGCAALPILRPFMKKRLIINIDGLEHKREKWKPFVRKFLKFSEKQAVKAADVIISDNKAIADYVRNEYGIQSEVIEYGGDQVLTDTSVEEDARVLGRYGLTPGDYALGVCRIEPENNVHLVLEAFKRSGRKLVFVGNWDVNEFGRSLKEKYGNVENIKLLPAIYDLKVLNTLRSNCSLYIHGHSAGGTNPSLVEAMFYGKPIAAFDVSYNRETTEHKAVYFDSADKLVSILNSGNDLSALGAEMKALAYRRYTWDKFIRQYESLYKS